MQPPITDRSGYDDLVQASPQGTIFTSRWWLEAVAPGSYRILQVERGGQVQAAWPIILRKRLGSRPIVTMAPLTPWLGILHRPTDEAKLSTRLQREKELADQLIDQLPSFAALHLHFHRNFDNWLPLYWRGFSQTTRYTYVLADLTRSEKLWAGMRENIRREIRKAERMGVEVESTVSSDEFWKVHVKTFQRQEMEIPYDFSQVKRVDAACADRACRKIFIARDGAGTVHAAAYIVWDEKSAYYLMGGGDPALRTSGAASLVLWEAIRFASTVTAAFDFEGSMLPGVERFFRAFGGEPKPYSAIHKVNSPVRIAYRAMREAFARLREG